MAFDKKYLKEKYKNAVVTAEMLDQIEQALGFHEVYNYSNGNTIDKYKIYIKQTPIWCQIALLNIIDAKHGICFAKQMPKILLHCIGVTYYIRATNTSKIGNYHNAINCLEMAVKKGCKKSYLFLYLCFYELADRCPLDEHTYYNNKCNRYKTLAVKHGNYLHRGNLSIIRYSYVYRDYIKLAIKCKNIKKLETDIVANELSVGVHMFQNGLVWYRTDNNFCKELVNNRIKIKKILEKQNAIIMELNRCEKINSSSIINTKSII